MATRRRSAMPPRLRRGTKPGERVLAAECPLVDLYLLLGGQAAAITTAADVLREAVDAGQVIYTLIAASQLATAYAEATNSKCSHTVNASNNFGSSGT